MDEVVKLISSVYESKLIDKKKVLTEKGNTSWKVLTLNRPISEKLSMDTDHFK